MNEFRNISIPHNDPLERLVEAFVEQSVPEGPDVAIERRMIAAMRAAASEGSLERTQGPAVGRNVSTLSGPRFVDQTARSRTSPARHWVAVAARQLIALAAAVLVVVGAAFVSRIPPAGHGDPQPGPTANDLIADAAPSEDAAVAAIDMDLAEQVSKLVDTLRRPDGPPVDPKSLKHMIDALRENPKLAPSEPWRLAHQRLSDALGQPGMISVGVGLLGTLPLTASARF